MSGEYVSNTTLRGYIGLQLSRVSSSGMSLLSARHTSTEAPVRRLWFPERPLPAVVKQRRLYWSFCEVGDRGTFLATGSSQGTRSAPSTSPATVCCSSHRVVQARANTLLTDFAYQAPPRGVLMPRAFNASAIWCSDFVPVRCISRITGSTLAAW
jgi:hypothetical protein